MTAASPLTPLRGLSVLLLEDEFLIALDAEGLLIALGAERVEVVNTLAAARAALDGEGFDLALLDVNVNGEMSFPVAEQYAARDGRGVRQRLRFPRPAAAQRRAHAVPEQAVHAGKPQADAVGGSCGAAGVRHRR